MSNSNATSPQSEESKSKTKNWIKYAIYGLIFVAVIVAYQFLPVQDYAEGFKSWIEGFGPIGWILFVLIYAVATLFLVPGSILTLAGGLAFGMWGFPLVVIGATLGAAMSFLSARYLVRERVEKYVKKNDKFQAIYDAIEDEGWKVVGLLRLSPAVPFSLQNWILGTTPVKFWPHLIATFFCIMPGTLLYVWIGSLGGSAAAGDDTSTAKYVMLGVGLVATLAVTILISRKAKAKLEEKGLRDED